MLVVEWADRFRELWPADHLLIDIRIDAKSKARRIKLTGAGPRSKKIIGGLKS